MANVTTTELTNIVNTTPSSVLSRINTLVGYVGEFTANPITTSHASTLDNVSVTKSKPENGIITFDFADTTTAPYGITITITYRS